MSPPSLCSLFSLVNIPLSLAEHGGGFTQSLSAEQRTQWLSVRLRTDNSPRLFQFGNRLSPLLSRLIMMTTWFFQVYGLQPILSHSPELRMVKPVPPGIAPPSTGTSAIPKVLPINFPLLIAAHPLFTVLCLSLSLDKLRTNSYPSPIKGKRGPRLRLAMTSGFEREG
jgi:hypothetical protein